MEIIETKYYIADQKSWGAAIDTVEIEKDGSMWAGNEEYFTRINYDPFTGKPAPTMIHPGKEHLIGKKLYITYE